MLSASDLAGTRATVALRMVHTVSIERSGVTEAGTPPVPVLDDYSQPVRAWAESSTADAFIAERSAREVALLTEAGAVVADLIIGLPAGTDVTTADRLYHDPAVCAATDDPIAEHRYQVHNVRQEISELVYLRLECSVVE